MTPKDQLSFAVSDLINNIEVGVDHVPLALSERMTPSTILDTSFLISLVDENTLFKYCERLRKKSSLQLRAIKLADGFEHCVFRLDGQKALI